MWRRCRLVLVSSRRRSSNRLRSPRQLVLLSRARLPALPRPPTPPLLCSLCPVPSQDGAGTHPRPAGPSSLLWPLSPPPQPWPPDSDMSATSASPSETRSNTWQTNWSVERRERGERKESELPGLHAGAPRSMKARAQGSVVCSSRPAMTVLQPRYDRKLAVRIAQAGGQEPKLRQITPASEPAKGEALRGTFFVFAHSLAHPFLLPRCCLLVCGLISRLPVALQAVATIMLCGTLRLSRCR